MQEARRARGPRHVQGRAAPTRPRRTEGRTEGTEGRAAPRATPPRLLTNTVSTIRILKEIGTHEYEY